MATSSKRVSRREFVRDTSGLLIGFSLLDATVAPVVVSAAQQQAATTGPARLDAWLKIEPDGKVRVFSGKADIGMGVETGYMQIVAEELDVTPERVVVIFSDTAVTPDQGGSGGSTAIWQGAKSLRNAAATARGLLVQMAARRLEAAPDQLDVRDGTIGVRGDATRTVTYQALVGGDGLQETLKVTGQGVSLEATGSGTPKDPKTYTVVGQSLPRVDLPPKIFGTFAYATSVRVDGMLHGRVVRPSGAGVRLASVDDSAAKAIPGFVRTVTKGNFVGVVAETEWGAIRAARALKLSWDGPSTPLPPQQDLYHYMRTTPPKASKEIATAGDVDAAFEQAQKRIEASYEFPFQAHATMDPGCAVADVRPDGITVWGGAQKMHALQRGLAQLFDMPAQRVRCIWVQDSGSYGRCGFEDVAADAALLSQAVGKPVRVQWSRADMTAWGGRAPAVICNLSAALDARGQATAVQFTSRAFSAQEVQALPQTAGNMLAAQLMGIPNTGRADEFAEWGTMAWPYRFTNLRATGHLLTALGGESSSPMRGSHLRNPNGPATTFAVESFIDEMAAAAAVDPIEFRLRHIEHPRARAVLMAAAEQHWDARPSPKPATGGGDTVTGRGIAIGTRRDTYVALVAEVEVNKRTGVVRVTRFTCFHDAGLMVNPNAVRGAVMAGLIQSMSRSLFEEVRFDRKTSTSVDWATYSVARATDIPAIEVVLLNHPELPCGGVGEPSSRPTAAAIANAMFDATGVRVRRAPFTPANVKEAFSRA